MRIKRLLATIGTATTLVGAGLATAPAESSAPGAFASMCPSMATSPTGLPVCTSVSRSKPWFHLPRTPSRTEVFGALIAGGYSRLATADGRSYHVPPEISPRWDGSRPMNQWISTIYRATVKNGVVAAIRPAARITERALLNRAYAGQVWEGRILRFNAGDARDPWQVNVPDEQKRTLPIRIRFADRATAVDHPDPLYPKAHLLARIENTSQKVRSADGRCLPAIARATDTPIFDGRSDRLAFQRQGGMHDAGEAPFLMMSWPGGQGSAMATGPRRTVTAAALLRGVNLPPRRLSMMIHTSDRAQGPEFYDLHRVSRGGEKC